MPPGGAMEAEVGEARRRPIWLEAAPRGRALTAWPRPWGGPEWSALKVPVPSGGESGRQLLCLLRVRAAVAAPAPGLLPCHQQHSGTPPGAAAEVGSATGTGGTGDQVGQPPGSCGSSPRCLDKLQLFQPSFEICPFETELNMDIAAALKVRLVTWSDLTAQPLPPRPRHPWTCCSTGPLPSIALFPSHPLTTRPWSLPLQRGNREWYDRLLNTKSPREQVQLREGMAMGWWGVGVGSRPKGQCELCFPAARAAAPCWAGRAGGRCLRGPAVLLRRLCQPLPQVGPGALAAPAASPSSAATRAGEGGEQVSLFFAALSRSTSSRSPSGSWSVW